MCNASNCAHDLDDQLDDIFGPGLGEGETVDLTLAKAQQVKMHEETCPSCRGSGRFRSWAGRVVGDCFKCKGKGKLFFRQSLEQREKARAYNAAARERKAASAAEQAAAWLSENPAEAKWLQESSARGFEFAIDLTAALYKYGALSERQEAAVRRATAKSAERQAQWSAERAERDANKADVDIARIAVAFAAAKASGLAFPKLRLDAFTFSLASERSANAGAIYVKQDELYLGKIVDGKLTRSRDCDAATEARIVAVCANPAEAAEAYGKLTGQCACCGRKLTNEESVARSIGPVCAAKWGF